MELLDGAGGTSDHYDSVLHTFEAQQEQLQSENRRAKQLQVELEAEEEMLKQTQNMQESLQLKADQLNASVLHGSSKLEHVIAALEHAKTASKQAQSSGEQTTSRVHRTHQSARAWISSLLEDKVVLTSIDGGGSTSGGAAEGAGGSKPAKSDLAAAILAHLRQTTTTHAENPAKASDVSPRFLSLQSFEKGVLADALAGFPISAIPTGENLDKLLRPESEHGLEDSLKEAISKIKTAKRRLSDKRMASKARWQQASRAATALLQCQHEVLAILVARVLASHRACIHKKEPNVCVCHYLLGSTVSGAPAEGSSGSEPIALTSPVLHSIMEYNSLTGTEAASAPLLRDLSRWIAANEDEKQLGPAWQRKCLELLTDRQLGRTAYLGTLVAARSRAADGSIQPAASKDGSGAGKRARPVPVPAASDSGKKDTIEAEVPLPAALVDRLSGSLGAEEAKGHSGQAAMDDGDAGEDASAEDIAAAGTALVAGLARAYESGGLTRAAAAQAVAQLFADMPDEEAAGSGAPAPAVGMDGYFSDDEY